MSLLPQRSTTSTPGCAKSSDCGQVLLTASSPDEACAGPGGACGISAASGYLRAAHALPDSRLRLSLVPTHFVPIVIEELSTRTMSFGGDDIQSRMQVDCPYALEIEYTRLVMGFQLLRPDARTIAMIGLGGGSIAKYCHRFAPKASLRVVEVNPHVVSLREKFAVPANSDRLAVLLGDGAEFVRSTPGRYDVLIVDAYTGSGMPSRLRTRCFYEQCREALTPGGILVVNLSCWSPASDEVLGSIDWAFAGTHFVVPELDGLNRVVFACNGAAPTVSWHDDLVPSSLPPSSRHEMRVAMKTVAAFAAGETCR